MLNRKKLLWTLLLFLAILITQTHADYTSGLIARYDFEWGDGSDSWGQNHLSAVGMPVIVNGVDGEMTNHKFMLVDTDAGKFQGIFPEGSAMDPGGLNAINGSYTIWISVTGPQHRWVNQTHYLYVDAGPDQYGRGPSQIKMMDQTYGSSTTVDMVQNPQWSNANYYSSLNHGGDYYSWPDVHQVALIWDQATQTSYIWNSVSGRQSFGDNSGLFLYGDLKWTLGAKHGDKSVSPWKAYIDEVRFYNQALTDTQLAQIASVSLSDIGTASFATNPTPVDNIIDIDPAVILSWAAGANMTNQNIYLGTDATAVAQANMSSPEYKGSTTNSNFNAGILLTAQGYYWRVDTVNAGGTVTGKVWHFTTKGSWDQTENLVARYDFEDADARGADSWGNNDLTAQGNPVFVDGVGAEEHGASFMLVDTDAGKLQGTFAEASEMDPGGLNAITNSFTIWLRVTGPQHRWVNQTHYLYVDAGPDQYGRGPSRIKMMDQTYGSSTVDMVQNPQWSNANYYSTLNHGGDYYSWPDFHQVALIWDQTTKTSYIWNSVNGRQSFGDHSGLYLYGDVTWTIGAKHGDKSMSPWQAYIDEVRFYDAALTDYQLSVITPVRKCGFGGYVPGDLNKDCVIDSEDLAKFAESWLGCTLPGERGCVENGYPWTTPE